MHLYELLETFSGAWRNMIHIRVIQGSSEKLFLEGKAGTLISAQPAACLCLVTMHSFSNQIE